MGLKMKDIDYTLMALPSAWIVYKVKKNVAHLLDDRELSSSQRMALALGLEKTGAIERLVDVSPVTMFFHVDKETEHHEDDEEGMYGGGE